MKTNVDKKVLIVYGGESAEHDISIITALTIFKKYALANVKIELVYCDKKGKFFVGEKLDVFSTYNKFDCTKFTEVAFLSKEQSLFIKKKNKYKKYCEIDFVINCFHGGAGEDGKFVAMLEDYKIPSSASSYKALAVAMDKYYTKLFALSLDVPVIDFFTFSISDWENSKDRVLQQVLQFDFPVVIKPVSQGSSIGVSLAKNIDEFILCVNLALKYDESVLVERAIIKKREFNCCVLKTSEGKLLARVDEPISDKVIISFNDKYLGGQNSGSKTKLKGAYSSVGMQTQERETKDKLTAKQRAMLIKHSRLLYDSLDMNGVVRFDYIMDTTCERFYLGEINAIPGSLGYYFFEDLNIVKIMYDAGKIYYNKRFSLNFSEAPTIFGCK